MARLLRLFLAGLLCGSAACSTDAGEDREADAAAGGDGAGPAGSAECIAYVSGWDPTAADYEREVLRLINQHRATGYDCPEGRRDPAGALTMDPAAQCAARVHSKWMGTNELFAHDSPGGPLGTAFDERLSNAGFSGGMPWGENIAWGQATPAAVVASWMTSSAGHCANAMDPAFARAGVGYFAASGPNWTLDFGGP